MFSLVRKAVGGCTLACLVTASGCITHKADPDPQPLFDVPSSYSMVAGPGEPPGTYWWESFADTELDRLIRTALKQNLTVAQAVERIDRAQALLRQARAVRLPQVDIVGEGERRWERERQKERDSDPISEIRETVNAFESFSSSVDAFLSSLSLPLEGGAADGGSGQGGSDLASSIQRVVDAERSRSDDPTDWANRYNTQFSGGLGLSWELDLWGRLRSDVKAQGEELAAAVQDYEALRLLLSSQVAEAYYQAVEQRLEYALLQSQRESARTFLDLLELRFLQGSASAVDVLQQRGQLSEIDAEIPVVEAQLRLFENRLDVLLGEPPDGVDRTVAESSRLPMDTALPQVGVPLALLQNRPDLIALQRRVVAADYRVGSAIAERLPRVTLDGSLVYGETSQTAAFTGIGAANLFQPLLDWGRRKAAVLDARSAFQEELLAFSEGYLIAIEEVETTLWQEARQRDLIELLVRREAILQQTLNETRVRYSLGVTDYLPVLTAIQDLQAVQRELIRERRFLVSLRIALYRATGGSVIPATEAAS